MEEDQTPGTGKVRLAFRNSYFGGRFSGSQMQADARTVEGEFIAACYRLQLFSDWRKAGFAFAGRTDRGVHARGQVCAFNTAYPDRAVLALNCQLPRDCWCTAYTLVDPSFHPRYDAKNRTYRYYFAEPDLDVAAMSRAAKFFLGKHDFSHFAKVKGKNPERCVLSVRIWPENEYTVFEVKAESFLWHMVRRMSAALLEVGRENETEDSIRKRLSGRVNLPVSAAPAEGLVLWDVDYGIRFTPLPPDKRTGRYVRHMKQHYATMIKICDLLD